MKTNIFSDTQIGIGPEGKKNINWGKYAHRIQARMRLFSGKGILLLAMGICFSLVLNAQVTKTINVTAAGTLSSALTDKELITITNLTITGIVDARDFNTIRNRMPLLSVLDLSEVTIVAYEGFLGPSPYSYKYSSDAIPDFAFYTAWFGEKSPLTTVVLPSSVTSIGVQAFYGCKNLTSISIPSLVNSIGEAAFGDCSSLTSLTIPSAVTTISGLAFSGCSGLTGILTIPKSVISIGPRAFRGCGGSINVDIDNPNYSSLDGVLFNKEQTILIHCPISKIGSYDIPLSVITIIESAFSNCTHLTNISIPTSVVSIESGAFLNCYGLTHVSIPSSVISIEDDVFNNCRGLTTITLPSSVTSIGYHAFYRCSGLTAVIIPSSVTLIGPGAFESCSGLTTVTIPSSVTSIGGIAFGDCSALITVNPNNFNYSSLDGVLYDKAQTTLIQCPISKIGSFTIPSSVTSIGVEAFYNCTNLTSITIPSSVSSIEGGAFYNCGGLTTITIPLTVNSIGDHAFAGCVGLTMITSFRIMPLYLDLSKNAFENVDKTTCILYVPFGSKSLYQTSNQWKDFINIVEQDLTGIASVISEQKLTIYPNPTTGKVKLVFDQIHQGGMTLTVNDFTGKTILTQFIQSKEETIDLKGNAPGVYLIRSSLKDGKVQRIILK